MVSFEVAEHLPESLADNYVRVISQFSPVVIMSAATVGQEGWIMSMSSRMNTGSKKCSGGGLATPDRAPTTAGRSGGEGGRGSSRQQHKELWAEKGAKRTERRHTGPQSVTAE